MFLYCSISPLLSEVDFLGCFLHRIISALGTVPKQIAVCGHRWLDGFFFPFPMRNYQVLRIVFYFIIMKGFFSSIQSHVVTEISLVASIWYSVEYIDESSVHFVWCYIESCCSIFACVQYNTGYNIVPFNCHCESIACGANRFAVQQQRSVVEWRVPHQ